METLLESAASIQGAAVHCARASAHNRPPVLSAGHGRRASKRRFQTRAHVCGCPESPPMLTRACCVSVGAFSRADGRSGVGGAWVARGWRVGGGRSGKHDVHELTVKVRSGETVHAPETSANVLRCAATASQKEEKKREGRRRARRRRKRREEEKEEEREEMREEMREETHAAALPFGAHACTHAHKHATHIHEQRRCCMETLPTPGRQEATPRSLPR